MPAKDGDGLAISTLKKRSEFLQASATGKRFITGSFVMQMLVRPAESVPPGIRIGYTVTKKIGNAVVRNRIKRRFREAARQVAPERATDGHDYVLIARHKAIDAPFSDLVRDMAFAFSRIMTIKSDAAPRPPHKKRKR